MQFKLGEFFCGPGGLAHGAISSGVSEGANGCSYSIQPAWATDYDLDTCRTYAKNIHNKSLEYTSHVFQEDVRNIDINKLEGCDGFSFGFPCNDFSRVGKAKGLRGKYGPLYSYGVKYLKIHQPKWFIAENVRGITSSNDGKSFHLILEQLKSAGYKIVPHLYKFEDYGIPQTRHRIIIIGIRKDLNFEFKVPAPFSKDLPATSEEALTVPPIPDNAFNNERTIQSSHVIERLKYIAAGQNAWSDAIPEHLRLNVKGAKLSNIYKRLDPKKPAYTVTGSGGGGTHMYHWEEHRALTNRERARLQTFPDDFIFSGVKESVRRQIGMAVPPEAAKILFKAILDTFSGNEYEHIPQNVKH